MPAGKTYTPIARTTLSSAGSVTFSNVPQTFTDLIIVVNVIATQTPIIGAIRFNGDGGNNYSSTRLVGDGSSASSTRYSNDDVLRTSIAYTDMTNIINIFNYTNTTTYKTAMSRSSAAGHSATAWVGLWRNTAAITSVTVTNLNYPAGTTFTLYGILAA